MNATNQNGIVYTTSFLSWQESLPPLLDKAGLTKHIPASKTILIKPNLVETLRPPITTPVALVRCIVDYLQKHLDNAIVIGEGCGALDYDTHRCFTELGYTKMARETGVELIDLNEAPCQRHSLPQCKRWPEFYLPEIATDSFLLSVPMLKAHTLAGVTLTMKNMMGLAPPNHYHQGGGWKKAAFHTRVHEAIADLNRYRSPDFTILDATVGMAEAHLWGPTCDPQINKLVAGFDPVAIDSYGAALLGKDWQQIGHIAEVDGELGQAAPITEIEATTEI
ncbi:DUF362 domain-containing protein [Desulfobulbus sp. US1]|nr:DUF362 domain-containing protein [Desulfobulbus sp. US4]MCW5204927.1 DUF362 domain-containing protein [Desulfobulbus sp. N2]MCW5208673.1 DUF362 domain-containing protein [Desulfobulbus sp. US1]MCW5213986.1 DUF362 domain-containing protein [Desulfobulbus sp. US5]